MKRLKMATSVFGIFVSFHLQWLCYTHGFFFPNPSMAELIRHQSDGSPSPWEQCHVASKLMGSQAAWRPGTTSTTCSCDKYQLPTYDLLQATTDYIATVTTTMSRDCLTTVTTSRSRDCMVTNHSLDATARQLHRMIDIMAESDGILDECMAERYQNTRRPINA